ncbi:MAG: hypothetical protein AAF267_03310 [Deinococcota bacterium]
MISSKIRTLISLALFSAGSLLLELSLARVFSVLYTQSYVFLLLSLAVLGIALGASLAIISPRLRQLTKVAGWLALAASSTLLVCGVVVLSMGTGLWLLLVLLLVPYSFLGLTLVSVFSHDASQSPLLYAVDLLGAGTMVLVSIPLLNLLGGLNAAVLAAVLIALASLTININITPSRSWASVLAVIVIGFGLVQAFSSFLQLDMQRLAVNKPILERLEAGANILDTRWDAFARTDLVYQPDQDAYYLYMDGGAGSIIPDAARPERWQQDIGRFPFVADEPDAAFLIGAGGGLDVAQAKAAGVTDITVVEVNRASVEMVRELEPYAGPLYDEPVEVLIDEGRSVLQRSQQAYDLIFLSQVISQAAEARGLVMAENRLYTVEAFQGYLEHLTPNGQVVFKLYDELTLTRALFTAVQSLSERGIPQAETSQHLLALLDVRSTPPIPLLVVKKQALDRTEAIRLARVAEAQGYALLFVPHLLANPPLDALVTGQLSLAEVLEQTPEVNLQPVTDNQPFFYQFEPHLPRFLQGLLGSLAAMLLIVIVLYGVVYPRIPVGFKLSPWLFACLGVGFMALEISLLQRTQLLLGHPTLALGLTLGLLLIGSGLGSYLTRWFQAVPRHGIAISALLIAVLWLLITFGWPYVETTLQGQRLIIRVLGVSGLVFLPAVFLGMPFPLALSRLGQHQPQLVAVAWSVNGLMSVFGSVAATALALQYGFASTAWLVVLSYGAVVVLALVSRD